MHVDAQLTQVLGDCLAACDTPVVISEAGDDLPIVYVNPAFEAMTGYRAEDVLGRNCRFLQGMDTDPATVRTLTEHLGAGAFVQVRLLNYRADGTPFWCELHLSPVRDAAGAVTRFIGIQHDVTAEVTRLQQATEAATRDALTGLMNRSAFAAATERELVRATRHRRSAGVLFLDVDRFKQVNDTFGHATGDAYLEHLARTLEHHLRGEDISARHAGDEFTVLLTDLPAGPAAAAAAIERAARHLSAALAEPFVVDGARHRVAVTIGRALFPHDGATVQQLLAEADADMYQRKRAAAG